MNVLINQNRLSAMKRYFVLMILFITQVDARAQEPRLMLPIGHTAQLYSAVFSVDGKWVLTASEDKTAKIWDVQSGLLLANLQGHTAAVLDASFSSDGNAILTLSADGTVKVWNTHTGSILYTINADDDHMIQSAAFSPDGKKILTTSIDGTASIFNTGTGKLLVTCIGHTGILMKGGFSSDGKYVLTCGYDSTARIWNADNGQMVSVLKGHKNRISDVMMSEDGKKVVTASQDSTARIWDVVSGKPLFVLKGKDIVQFARFNSKGTQIITTSFDNLSKIWDVATGKLVYTLDGKDGYIYSATFSPDGKKAITGHDHVAVMWDLTTGKSIRDVMVNAGVTTINFSKDGSRFVTGSDGATTEVWDTESGKPLVLLDGHTFGISSEHFSPDGKSILTSGEDAMARIWDMKTGQLKFTLKGHFAPLLYAEYSPDGKKVATASLDSSVKVWDANTGKLLKSIDAHKGPVTQTKFSPDGNILATASDDKTVKLWNTKTWELLRTLKGHKASVSYIGFSPDNRLLVSFSSGAAEHTVRLWDAATGNMKATIERVAQNLTSIAFSPDSKKLVLVQTEAGRLIKKQAWIPQNPKIWDIASGNFTMVCRGNTDDIEFATFSPDGKKMLAATMSGIIYIWETNSGKLLNTVIGHTSMVEYVEFSADGRQFISAADDNTAKVWDTETGKLLFDLKGHLSNVLQAHFSKDGLFILTKSSDNTLKKWNAVTGELMYTFFAVNNDDYLVLDKDQRYDGTPGARKLLYFTCDNEIIELEQFEDLCWEPGLASKINGVNKEPITAKKISDINICNFTPEVVQEGLKEDGYHFTVQSRNGGVGEVQLYVNGKMIKTFDPQTLTKTANNYALTVKTDLVKPYFIKGSTNQVLIKATTKEGTMTSRGITMEEVATGVSNVNPNMYIVSIGINKYKGEKIQLNYASTDAESFGAALNASAKKLLNTDGKEHVKNYVFSTETNNTNWPAKAAIRKKLEEIALIANPEDIMVIFFAGHGVLQSGQKNFYLLTAEATGFEMSGVEKEVAISTDELNTWMQNIKANKQLLILDACNSGQAVSDLQELIAKRDVPADQVRALENLKDKNGTFILSASASGQSAYETSQFGQGLLTYSLLSGIKNQDGLKENKYIDVTRWFNNASDNVRAMAKEIGGRQEPQIIGNASFDVGLVDEEVMNGIKLSVRKMIFARSIVYSGDPLLLIDPLQLSNEIDKELNNQSARGAASPLTYIENNLSADAYSIRGIYETKGNVISAKISLIKQNKKVKDFLETGRVDARQVYTQKIVNDITLYLKSVGK